MASIPFVADAVVELANTYLRILQEKAVLGTPELRQTVVSHIHDLAALTLGANRAGTEDGLSAVAGARLAAALGHIAESLTEPGLTVAAVARRQGVSPRYLQRLLEASGTSFTAHVNELRLQRVFALLTKAHARGHRISDIALEAGFSDISNFNRLFRSRFGDTPSGIRRSGDGAHDDNSANVAGGAVSTWFLSVDQRPQGGRSASHGQALAQGRHRQD
jgi:AraC-like DNA-binding protein